jgi:hypothetical protein
VCRLSPPSTVLRTNECPASTSISRPFPRAPITSISARRVVLTSLLYSNQSALEHPADARNSSTPLGAPHHSLAGTPLPHCLLPHHPTSPPTPPPSRLPHRQRRRIHTHRSRRPPRPPPLSRAQQGGRRRRCSRAGAAACSAHWHFLTRRRSNLPCLADLTPSASSAALVRSLCTPLLIAQALPLLLTQASQVDHERVPWMLRLLGRTPFRSPTPSLQELLLL